MKRTLTIGAVAALAAGLSLPAAALPSATVPELAFAADGQSASVAAVQSLDVTAAAGGAAKDTFDAAEKPVDPAIQASSYSGPLPEGFGGIQVWPSTARVNDGFGYRDGGEFHDGLDIMCGYGAVLVAAADGVVTFSGYWGGYGNVVIINHGSGVETYYAHQSVLYVTAGDWVTAGTPIGESGDTGYTTAPHLHFELHIDGVAIDPMPYMP